jgi:signal transduction histidine kinase
MINGGTQLIGVFTDITTIKEVEKQGKLLRSHFFTSVAHELRTPLNSIIPVIKMILALLASNKLSKEQGTELLTLVLHSAMHLASLIEDALDISRLENNKFQLFNEIFNVRNTIEEIRTLLEFQVKQKNLYLSLRIDEDIPEVIYADPKRVR